MSTNYYLPTHCDIGNRGCEAITRATGIILDAKKDCYHILTQNIGLDSSFHLDDMATIHPMGRMTKFSWQMYKINKLITKDPFKRNSFVYSAEYDSFLNLINPDGVMLSTGGDMYCYGDNEAVYTSLKCQKKGLKTILWGCSMGKENMSELKLKALKGFNLIYVRESLSMDFLHSIGLKRLCLYPDPAFILDPEPFELYSFMNDGELVGLNLSNLVLGGFSMETSFGCSVLELVDYILKETKFNIMLIPHVMWKDQDDRLVSDILMKKYASIGRVFKLNTSNLNYCQIRYAISKCRFFIGARTHSVISAYSTLVPTIALGYSIKSKGIAKDLGMDERLIVNSKSTGESILLDSFKFMIDNEDKIRNHLEQVVPSYKKSVFGIKNELKSL